jgi:hypothetical protein
LKRDPLRRWEKLEERASQVKKGDLKSALQYLSGIIADFRNPDPQKDPEGYAVHRMAVTLRDALKGVTALDTFDLAELELPSFDAADLKELGTDLQDFKIADSLPVSFPDDKTCPMCGTQKKTKR